MTRNLIPSTSLEWNSGGSQNWYTCNRNDGFFIHSRISARLIRLCMERIYCRRIIEQLAKVCGVLRPPIPELILVHCVHLLFLTTHTTADSQISKDFGEFSVAFIEYKIKQSCLKINNRIGIRSNERANIASYSSVYVWAKTLNYTGYQMRTLETTLSKDTIHKHLHMHDRTGDRNHHILLKIFGGKPHLRLCKTLSVRTLLHDDKLHLCITLKINVFFILFGDYTLHFTGLLL